MGLVCLSSTSLKRLLLPKKKSSPVPKPEPEMAAAALPTVPPPDSPLAQYRILSPNCGLRVSPVQLGCMNFGDSHSSFLGGCSKEQSFKILDQYYSLGGNFLDTANVYQEGESELWVGDWIKERGNREELVLATKYSCLTPGKTNKIKVNAAGNTAKSLKLSLETSLERLQTSYIDILYIHWYDWMTPIPEIMKALHSFVLKGKVLYLGISNTPAWVVSKANQYARDNGLTEFVIYQGEYNVLKRDMEDEVIPMALAEGMAIAPWSVLGGGRLQSAAALAARQKSGEGLRTFAGRIQEPSEGEAKMSAVLEKVANEIGDGITVTSVALAYALQKFPYVFPLIGGRKVEHLLDNLKAFTFALTEKQYQEIDAVEPHQHRYPGGHFGTGRHNQNFQPNFMIQMAGQIQNIKAPTAITPAQ